MVTEGPKDFFDRLFDFSTQMTAVSLAIVAVLLVVTYEFQHSGGLTGVIEWSRFTHDGIGAAIFFSLSSFFGLVQKIPLLHDRARKTVSYCMAAAFFIGWALLLFLLIVLLNATY